MLFLRLPRPLRTAPHLPLRRSIRPLHPPRHAQYSDASCGWWVSPPQAVPSRSPGSDSDYIRPVHLSHLPPSMAHQCPLTVMLLHVFTLHASTGTPCDDARVLHPRCACHPRPPTHLPCIQISWIRVPTLPDHCNNDRKLRRLGVGVTVHALWSRNQS